jgi:hypothetical protein
VLDAADQLHLQELVDYLQTYLIENKDQWTEQHFEQVYQFSFQSNFLLELKQYCVGCMAKFPDKIFKSIEFNSIQDGLPDNDPKPVCR